MMQVGGGGDMVCTVEVHEDKIWMTCYRQGQQESTQEESYVTSFEDKGGGKGGHAQGPAVVFDSAVLQVCTIPAIAQL
jgi:hypothetical protein